MQRKLRHRPAVMAMALLLAYLLAWPSGSLAQSAVTGQASAVQATLFGAPTILGILGSVTTQGLAQTGSLSGSTDARDASTLAGSIPSLLTAEAIGATTIGYPNEVDSAASLQNLSMTVAGIGISADSVMAEATMVSGTAGSGISYISGLAVNGVPISISGAPNQVISILGGQLVINEQTVTSTGAFVVNALHLTIPGVADVVVASATAGA